MFEARQNVIDAMLMIASMLGNDYVKTVAHYTRVIQRAARAFYSGRIDSGEFIGRMIEVIEVQMRKAWYEGMRANDLDPAKDMQPDWEKLLQSVIDGEFNYVLDYASAIEQAAAAQSPITPLLDRADLWANRYNEVVNLSMLTTRPQDRYKWVMGATEQHCETCYGLNGKIATAADWLGSGYRPQGRNLKCGGWRCQCRLEYTEEKPTQIGAPMV